MNLADIAPPTPVTVSVGGQKYELRGITAKEYNDLRERFADFDKFLEGNRLRYPDIMAAFVATSLGYHADAEAEKLLGALVVGQLLNLFSKASEKTFPPLDEADPAAQQPSSGNSPSENAAEDPTPGAT